jgi:anti-sigma factor RsiW
MAEHDTDLTCAEAVELMSDYVEGALGEAARARFEQHLALCPGCDNYLDQVRYTISIAGRLAEDDVPPGLRTELLHAFRGWKGRNA